MDQSHAGISVWAIRLTTCFVCRRGKTNKDRQLRGTAHQEPRGCHTRHVPPRDMPHLSLIHPIDGVDAWCRTQYSRRLRYAFLSDDATQERTRLCVEDLRHAAVDARDALIAWAQDHRARDGATAVPVAPQAWERRVGLERVLIRLSLPR